MSPITEAEARWIRVLRVDMGCTWGRVAELFGKATGDSDTTQMHGAALCRWAANMLGEDPTEEPWN
jgi:hypothetical protein